MSAREAVLRLTEATAKAAEIRTHLMGSLLARPGVLDFVAVFDGDPEPDRIAESAQAFGLEGLDEIDVGLLAIACGFTREAALAGPGERWIERR